MTKQAESGEALHCASMHELLSSFAARAMEVLPISDVVAMTRYSDSKVLFDFDVPSDIDDLSEELRKL